MLFFILKKNIIRCMTCIIFISLLSILSTSAQSSGVNEIRAFGQIVDENGVPIIGATLSSDNGTYGSISDVDGNFNFVVSDDIDITISCVGYKSQKLKASFLNNKTITLYPDIEMLEEVVVVGYGTQRKKDLTGAISVVDKDVLKNKSVTTIGDALQGAAPGVYVRGGSKPGQGANIEIRGVNSLTNNAPLFVIDGLLTDGNRDLNPSDIESIQILKDASAAAIYGSRAANGVVVITTKKGKEGPMKIDVSLKKSFQITPRYDLMDREGYIRLNDMAYDNAEIPRQMHPADIDTDWQDETFRLGIIDDYNLSLSGGGKNSSYMVSGNYFNNKGVVIGSEFNRISFRVNTEAKRGIFRFGENLSVNSSKSKEFPGNPYWEVLRMLPTIPVYDETNPGGYGYGNGSTAKTFGSNPVALLNLNDQRNNNFRISGNIFAEIDLFKYLKYKINWGYDNNTANYKSVTYPGNWTMNQPEHDSKIYENRGTYYSSIVENTLSYNQVINKHRIDALTGITYQRERYDMIGAQKNNLLYVGGWDYLNVVDAGTTDPQAYGNTNESIMISYLGRVNYNYADKYLASFTVRVDGSSKFGKDNRWGTFPSFSLGWRISQEKFFNVKAIDDLKIRANYGTLGSVNIGCYDYFALVNTNTPAIFGGQLQEGSTQVKLVNKDIKWETLVQQNYGIDMTMLNNRLFLTMDYFISNSRDILYGTPIPSSTGNDGGNPVVNAATLKNSGFELSLNWKDKIQNVKYNLGLNFWTLSNEVKGLGYKNGEVKTSVTLSKVGKPLGMWYLIKTDGLFQNEQDILNHVDAKGNVIQPDAKPGDIRFVDFNGDGQITDADRQEAGSPWADFEAGFTMGAEWKGFDISLNWFASVGSKLFNYPRQLTDRFDDNSNYRKGISPWTKEGDTGTPRAVYASTNNSLLGTDRWLENGSFLKLKEMSIGYNFSHKLLSKIKVDRCRIYISGQNLFTITGYTGLDPEFSGNSLYDRGVDNANFPNAMSFTGGLSLTF